MIGRGKRKKDDDASEATAAGPKLKAEVTIGYVRLDDIAEAPRNPKEHDIGAIIQSMQRFGFVTPGVVNEGTGRIVVGHGRAHALLKMREDGFPPPERIGLDEGGDWTVPVVRGITFKSDAEAEAFVVTDNRLTELGGWDHSALPEVLGDLAAIDLLDVTGFDADDLAMYQYWLGDSPERPPLPPADPAFVGGGKVPRLRVMITFEDAHEQEQFFIRYPGAYRPGVMTYRYAQMIGAAAVEETESETADG